MPGSPVFTGARAKLGIADGAGGVRYIGIFNNVSFGFALEVADAFILGRFQAAALTYVSQNVVNITASGYRVIEHGPYIESGLPRVQDLLNYDYLEFVITDRQLENGGTDPRVYKFHSVRPTGYSTTIGARAQVELALQFTAISADDESGTNNESVGASVLPG